MRACLQMILAGFCLGFGTMAFAAEAIGAAPVPGGIDWAQWGMAGAVVGLTMLQSWLREVRMSKALDDQQKWIQEKFIVTLDKVTEAIEKCERNR